MKKRVETNLYKGEAIKQDINNATQIAEGADTTANTALGRATAEYGVCTEGSDEQNKTVTIEGFTELYQGATCSVTFNYRNTAGNPTLNVNGTGARPIYARGSGLSARSGYNWENGATVQFVYDGSYWVMMPSNMQEAVNVLAGNNDNVNTNIMYVEQGQVYINADHITTGTLDATNVNVTNIDASKITVGTLVSEQIGVGQIKAENLATDSVTADAIQANSITGTEIATNAIESKHIEAGAITSDKIEANAITSAKIEADAITADKLATDSVTADAIKANSVGTDELQANSVTANEIASKTITANEIASKTITANEIEARTITANEIATGAITSDKISASAITADKISSNAVTSTKIANSSITTAKIADNSVSVAKMVGEISEDDWALDFTNGTFTIGTISANNISGGTISGNLIKGGIISGVTFKSEGSAGAYTYSLELSSGVITMKQNSNNFVLISPAYGGVRVYDANGNFATLSGSKLNFTNSSSSITLGGSTEYAEAKVGARITSAQSTANTALTYARASSGTITLYNGVYAGTCNSSSRVDFFVPCSRDLTNISTATVRVTGDLYFRTINGGKTMSRSTFNNNATVEINRFGFRVIIASGLSGVTVDTPLTACHSTGTGYLTFTLS